MPEFHVAVGDTATFTKTVSESDVYLFSGITGDLAPNHVDAAYMAKTSFGRRIAHGALLVGYMSNTSTQVADQSLDADETAVSAGYDRIRFLKPVFIGDTVTVRYEVTEIQRDRNRSISDIRVTNQDGELVAVARHILQWVPNDAT